MSGDSLRVDRINSEPRSISGSEAEGTLGTRLVGWVKDHKRALVITAIAVALLGAAVGLYFGGGAAQSALETAFSATKQGLITAYNHVAHFMAAPLIAVSSTLTNGTAIASAVGLGALGLGGYAVVKKLRKPSPDKNESDTTGTSRRRSTSSSSMDERSVGSTGTPEHGRVAGEVEIIEKRIRRGT